MSEFKPGDLAMVTVEGFDPKRAIFTDTGKWRDAEDCRLSPDASDTTYRRLVVIDPEDREQVERLLSSVHSVGVRGDWSNLLGPDVDHLQAALRKFANPKPPKPDEPTGLGAVVEDAHGELWVRDKTTTTVAHWKRARGEMGGKRIRYDDIDAVRVLSEGVQP